MKLKILNYLESAIGKSSKLVTGFFAPYTSLAPKSFPENRILSVNKIRFDSLHPSLFSTPI